MSSELVGFHFAQPHWLWLCLIPLLLWLLPPGRRQRKERQSRLQQYADPHLLPHLYLPPQTDQRGQRSRLWAWSLLWWLGILAMAGPRWDYTEVSVFQPGSDVVILFDLSRSMEAADMKPSRLARARQEVEDLLNLEPNIRIGLIAFATVAHVVSPITEDTHTLRHVLPSLGSHLVQLQGSHLSEALDRAHKLFAGQPAGNSRAVLLISDGDFAEPELEQAVRKLRRQGVQFYVLGVGTEDGGYVPDDQGDWLRDKNGNRVVSRLDEGQLQELARAGDGLYLRADYRDSDSQQLLQRIRDDAPPMLENNPVRIWQERYYLLVGLMLFLLLLRFRQGRGVLRR